MTLISYLLETRTNILLYRSSFSVDGFSLVPGDGVKRSVGINFASFIFLWLSKLL